MNFDYSDAFFIGFILIMQIMWMRERRGLYNRIMARNLTELSAVETEAIKAKKPQKQDSKVYTI